MKQDKVLQKSVFATCMGDQMAYKVEAKTPAMILSIREKNKNRFPIRTRYHENNMMEHIRQRY